MNAVAVMSAPTMPVSGSSVRSIEVPVAHHSPARLPSHCSSTPTVTPMTPVTTNARIARAVPRRSSAMPSRVAASTTPATSWNGSAGMASAVSTLHQRPSSIVVPTPAAQVASVSALAAPTIEPVITAVAMTSTAKAKLNGTRRANPATAEVVD
ncbi:hypothetical protein [Agromyces albus]|uniref:hypothetical protein n=1 Tax=Agromyces albus TaxID=205332 RepID=UPI002781B7CC|nr:hypothetical protein [Agromyces albus]MDQ0577503.1 hypothetical protein [Agromyces albus]